MIYPHTVTFQAPTQSQLPSGHVTNAWADIEALTDLPARVIPAIAGSRTAGGDIETQAERFLLQRETFSIILQGDHDVERDMRAVTSHLDMTLGVIRVQRPTLGGTPMTHTTIVEAERVDVRFPVES